jgi:hypothetical protein
MKLFRNDMGSGAPWRTQFLESAVILLESVDQGDDNEE